MVMYDTCTTIMYVSQFPGKLKVLLLWYEVRCRSIGVDARIKQFVVLVACDPHHCGES